MSTRGRRPVSGARHEGTHRSAAMTDCCSGGHRPSILRECSVPVSPRRWDRRSAHTVHIRGFRMLRRFYIVLIAIVGALPLLAQQPQPAPAATQALPIDPKVRIGTLPNGLRYYIRQNPKPEKRAELRLVVN